MDICSPYMVVGKMGGWNAHPPGCVMDYLAGCSVAGFATGCNAGNLSYAAIAARILAGSPPCAAACNGVARMVAGMPDPGFGERQLAIHERIVVVLIPVAFAAAAIPA